MRFRDPKNASKKSAASAIARLDYMTKDTDAPEMQRHTQILPALAA
jgi:hypothetical protein